MSAYEDQLKSGFSKWFEYRLINLNDFLKWTIYGCRLVCRNIDFTFLHLQIWHWTKQTECLLYMWVRCHLVWSKASKCYYRVQTFWRQSESLALWDSIYCLQILYMKISPYDIFHIKWCHSDPNFQHYNMTLNTNKTYSSCFY